MNRITSHETTKPMSAGNAAIATRGWLTTAAQSAVRLTSAIQLATLAHEADAHGEVEHDIKSALMAVSECDRQMRKALQAYVAEVNAQSAA